MSRRGKLGTLPVCSACRGLGWRMRKNPADGAGPCPSCKGRPVDDAVRVLSALLPCSDNTARRILRGQRISLRTLGLLASAAERVEGA